MIDPGDRYPLGDPGMRPLSRRDMLAIAGIVALSVTLGVLLAIGGFWLHSQFARQARQEVHHSLIHVCHQNASAC